MIGANSCDSRFNEVRGRFRWQAGGKLPRSFRAKHSTKRRGTRRGATVRRLDSASRGSRDAGASHERCEEMRHVVKHDTRAHAFREHWNAIARGASASRGERWIMRRTPHARGRSARRRTAPEDVPIRVMLLLLRGLLLGGLLLRRHSSHLLPEIGLFDSNATWFKSTVAIIPTTASPLHTSDPHGKAGRVPNVVPARGAAVRPTLTRDSVEA